MQAKFKAKPLKVGFPMKAKRLSPKRGYGRRHEGLKPASRLRIRVIEVHFCLRRFFAALSLVALVVFGSSGGTYAQEGFNEADDNDLQYEVPATDTKFAAPKSDSLFTPSSYLTTDSTEWEPATGDKLEINVETNIARLVHENGESLQFEIVSGQRRIVRYIGRRYFAGTPSAEWVARETAIKRDRWTFGKTGRFIRLYKVVHEGVEKDVEDSIDDVPQTEIFTPYGIHPFGREDAMFRVAGRYGSMGCIIMREKMVDLIQETIRANGGELRVRTFPEMPEV